MKRLPAVLLALLFSPLALATAPAGETTGACTPDEANRLASETAERVNEILANDPERATAINAELREMRLKRTAESLEHECEAYRTRMQDIERARDKAGLPHEDEVRRPAPQHPAGQ